MAKKERGKVTSLKESLDEFLDVYKLKSGYNLSLIKAVWNEKMGQTIVKRTKQIYFKDSKLMVKIDSAPLKHQLHIERNKIKENLNKSLGAEVIEDVIFL